MQFFKKALPATRLLATAGNRFALFGILIVAGLFTSLGWLARSDAEPAIVSDTGTVTVSVINAEKKIYPQIISIIWRGG